MITKNRKGFIKKAVAGFLAVVMASSYAPAFEARPPLEDLGPLGIYADFDNNLITTQATPIDPQPALQAADLPTSQVHLSWPMVFDAAATDPDDNRFTLTYHLTGVGNVATQRTLTVQLLGPGQATVVYDPGGTTGAFAINKGLSIATPGPNFVTIPAHTGAGYHPMSNAPDDPDNAGTIADGFYQNRFYPFPTTSTAVRDQSAFYIDLLASTLTPSFGIVPGTGFSFRQQPGTSADMTADHAVSFLWDDGMFHVVIGGLQLGRIYEFDLERGSEEDIARAFTGLSYEARPLARHRETPRGAGDPLFNPSRGDLDGFTNWDFPLEHANNHLLHRYPVGRQVDTVTDQNDWYPAGFMPHDLPEGQAPSVPPREYPVRHNLMEVVVNDPQVLNAAGTAFVPKPPADLADLFEDIQLSFAFGDFDNPTIHNFTVTNFFVNPVVSPTVGISVTAVRNNADGNVRMLIDGAQPFALEPSQIFPSSSILMSYNPEIREHMAFRTGMQLARLYTFLEYNIVFMEGAFHVRLIPYSVGGTYSLHFVGGQGPAPGAGSVHVSAADAHSGAPIFIPFVMPAAQNALLQIVFEPAHYRIDTIRSQVMDFVATADRMILTAPIDFTVTPNTPELRYVLGGGGLAEFEITASWQMGELVTMRNYFDLVFGGNNGTVAAPDFEPGEIVFTYALRARTYPEQEEPILIGYVDFVVRRNAQGALDSWVRDIRLDDAFIVAETDEGLFVRGAGNTAFAGSDMQFRVGDGDPEDFAWTVYEHDGTNWVPATVATIDNYGVLTIDEGTAGRELRVRAASGAESGYAMVTVTAPNSMPITMADDTPFTAQAPLTFVVDSHDGDIGSPMMFSGIYFLSGVLWEVNHPNAGAPIRFNPLDLHESSHNDRSYVTISPPDLRDLPGPGNLELLVPEDVEERLRGSFDMRFTVPWGDIESYINRSPFAAYNWSLYYRVFIGNQADIVETVQMQPQDRTTAIASTAAGTPTAIKGPNAGDLVPPIAPPRNNWTSQADDFNFTPATLNRTTVLGDISLRGVITQPILGMLDVPTAPPAAVNEFWENLDAAFVTHLTGQLATVPAASIDDWLTNQMPTMTDAQRDAVIASMRTGATPDNANLQIFVDPWRMAIEGFNWVPFFTEIEQRTVGNNWTLHPGDINIGAFPGSTPIDEITLQSRVNDDILARAGVDTSAAGWERINEDFVAHLITALGRNASNPGTLRDWLESTAAQPTQDATGYLFARGEALDFAWQLVLTGNALDDDAWDNIPEEMRDRLTALWPTGATTFAGINTVINQFVSAITGFNSANNGWAGFRPPPPPPAPGDFVVNSISQGHFDFTPFMDILRRDGGVVLEIPLEFIRDDQNNIIPFPASFVQEFTFEGADYNWAYYAFVDSVIEFRDSNGDRVFPNLENPSSREYSNNTDIRGVRTRIDIVQPDPDEVVPPAPGDLRRDRVTLNSATISWLDVPPLSNTPGSRIEFEIVRMRSGQVVPESLLTRRDQSVRQFVDAMDSASRANFEATVRTDRRENAEGNEALTLVNPPSFSQGADVVNSFNLSHPGEGRVQLENLGLVPNTLYFYYVRTIWINADGGYTRSNWVSVSATTTIIQPPINLRVLDHRAMPDVPVNAMNEVLIRFEAPVGGVGPGSTIAEDHGNIFDFRIALRQDGGQWQTPYVFLPSTISTSGSGHRLVQRVPIEGRPGYYEFTYVITGLRPGTTYDIRVHTFDRQNSVIADIFTHVYSEWSNIARTRTGTDPEFDEAERDRENLNRYLRDLLMDFIRRPYWVANDASNNFTALYRPTMVNYLLQSQTGQIILLADTDQPTSVFYLPQYLFTNIWNGRQSLVVRRGDIDITIANQTFNNISSQAILSAGLRIRDVRGVEDYYIRLTVGVGAHTHTNINGSPPAGGRVEVSAQLVEANMLARQLDLNILRRIQYQIETDYYATRTIGNRTQTFQQEINNMIARGMSYEYMVRRVRQIAEIITQEMIAEVNSMLRPTLARTTDINYFDAPVTVGLRGMAASANVSGYQLAGTTWARLDVLDQGQQRVLRTQVPGVFAFAARVFSLPGLDVLPGSDRLQTLIGRYNLAEFLGEGATFDLNAPLSLPALQGIIARLAGAPNGANGQTWLSGRGYIAPFRGANAPAQTQEAVYMIMALHEIRTGTSVSSLRISNHNALNGINGLDSRYRPFVAAAFELNIFNNANMNPTAPITVGDFLRMLNTLDQRIGL